MRLLLQWVVLSSILLPFGGSAHRRTEEGNRQYEGEQYDDALRSYTEAQVEAPQSAELYYNIGNVLYRQGDHEGAAEAYARSLLMAPPELEGAAAYNLGNARYETEAFQDAIKAFERALRVDPSDQDAKRNLELALRARQEQQQQQDPQQDGEQDQQEQQEQQPAGGEQEQQEQQPQSQPEPSEGAENRESEEPQSQPRPGEMTQEDAERLLDGLEEQEMENLRKQALRQAPRAERATEKDW